MQESWLFLESTLYTRTAFTPSCWRNGASRAQAAASARGSKKFVGSAKGAFGSLLSSPREGIGN